MGTPESLSAFSRAWIVPAEELDPDSGGFELGELDDGERGEGKAVEGY